MYTYLSYRDPNLMKTIEAYDGTPGFLRSLELDDDTLTKVCIDATSGACRIPGSTEAFHTGTET